MTVEAYEQKRRAHAMKVQAMLTPDGTKVRSPDRPRWGAIDAGEAAKIVGRHRSEVMDAAKACHRCGGVRWHLDGQKWAPRREYRGGGRTRCVETGDEFVSMAAAARWVEQYTGQKTYKTSVNWATRANKPICGLHFVRLPHQTTQKGATPDARRP
jgi:hypothetical protein